MHMPFVLPSPTTVETNGSARGPSGPHIATGGMAGVSVSGDGRFAIAPTAQENVAEKWSHPLAPVARGMGVVPRTAAPVRVPDLDAEGGAWGACDTGRPPPGSANAALDRDGLGQVDAVRLLVGENSDQGEPPARIDVEVPADDGNTVPPVRLPVDQPSESAVLPVAVEHGRGGPGAPFAGPAQFEAGQPPPEGQGDWLRSGGAGPGPSPIVQTANGKGDAPASGGSWRGVIAGVDGESGPVPFVRSDMIEDSVAQTDRSGGAPPASGQTGRGAVENPSTMPELIQRRAAARDGAETAEKGPFATKPAPPSDVPTKDQVAAYPGLPAASLREEGRPQAMGQHQVASGNNGSTRVGAPDRLPATAPSNDGMVQSDDGSSLPERPVSKQIERSAQTDSSVARGLEAQGAPVTSGSQVMPLGRHPDATPLTIHESAASEGDQIRSIDGVPVEPRVPEVARSAPDHGAVARADQGRAIAVQIAEVLRASGNRAVELRLQPEELGRVSLTMSQEGGQLHVTLAAERPETLDLMRRHIDLLGEELRRLGHGAVQFSFEDGAGRNRERTSPPPGPGDQARVSDPGEPGPQTAIVRPPPTAASGSAGGMDIRM